MKHLLLIITTVWFFGCGNSYEKKYLTYRDSAFLQMEVNELYNNPYTPEWNYLGFKEYERYVDSEQKYCALYKASDTSLKFGCPLDIKHWLDTLGNSSVRQYRPFREDTIWVDSPLTVKGDTIRMGEYKPLKLKP